MNYCCTHLKDVAAGVVTVPAALGECGFTFRYRVGPGCFGRIRIQPAARCLEMCGTPVVWILDVLIYCRSASKSIDYFTRHKCTVAQISADFV